jgi:glyoxylase-like metal-dependent hydrolase (beta-lactamase superfamily II)
LTISKVITLLFTGFLLPVVGIGQGQSDINVTELAEGLYQIQTDAGAWTTNMVAFIGEDGLLLVDSGEKEFLEGLKNKLKLLYPGNPIYILNTHAHVDHTGGNAAFGAEPVIIAHDIVKNRLRSGRYVIEEFPDEALPDITFNDSLTLFFNGETIRMIAVPGSHSDNDVIVHFAKSGVVCLGDLAYGMHFPSVDGLSGAWPDLHNG